MLNTQKKEMSQKVQVALWPMPSVVRTFFGLPAHKRKTQRLLTNDNSSASSSGLCPCSYNFTHFYSSVCCHAAPLPFLCTAHPASSPAGWRLQFSSSLSSLYPEVLSVPLAQRLAVQLSIKPVTVTHPHTA